jgi:hypothetical protein
MQENAVADLLTDSEHIHLLPLGDQEGAYT